MKALVDVKFQIEVEVLEGSEIEDIKAFKKEWFMVKREVVEDITKGIQSAMGWNGGLEIRLYDPNLTQSEIAIGNLKVQ